MRQKTSFLSRFCTKACKRLKNDFKLTRFAFALIQKFEAVPHEWKSLLNPSDTQQRYSKYLTNLVFSVRTVSYGASFFSPTITNSASKRYLCATLRVNLSKEYSGHDCHETCEWKTRVLFRVYSLFFQMKKRILCRRIEVFKIREKRNT